MKNHPSQKLYGLDHLRALAIMLVFFYHYTMFAHPSWLESFAGFGWMGVDLFFVLSGYLISSQLFREIKRSGHISFKNFYGKRFFRIIPPFAVVLLLYFCIPAFREREALPPLWKFLTFTQNLGLDVVHFGTFSHAWSLCIEEQFYLLLPLILWALYRYRLFKYVAAGLLLLLVLVIVGRFLSWLHYIVPLLDTDSWGIQWYKKIYYPTYTRLDGLAVGVLIGYLFENNKRVKDFIVNKTWLSLLLSISFLISACLVCEEQTSELATIIGFTLVALGFGFLVVHAVSQSSVLYKWKSFFTEQLASLSYSIYLVHKGIIHITQAFLEKHAMDKDSNMALLLCVINCVLAALVMRYVIERPALYVRNKILRTKKEQVN